MTSSGKRRRRRIDGEDPRRPAMETAMVAVLQHVRDLVARWGERGGRGGAFERIGEARGWRWPRGSSSVAVAPFGRGRERKQRKGKSSGESERVPEEWRGTHGGVRGVEVERQAGGDRGVRRRASATRLCLLARGGRRQGGSGDGLGRAGPGKWAPGKLGRWPGGLLSLSLLVSVFYFFLSLF